MKRNRNIFGKAARPKTDAFVVIIPPEAFEQLKDDLKFRHALALGRHLNRLNFIMTAFIDSQSYRDTVKSRRQTLHSCIFFAGAMHEALEFALGLEQFFGDSRVYAEQFRPVINTPFKEAVDEFKKVDQSELDETGVRDPVINSFYGVLQAYRNKVAFHVDKKILTTTMKSSSPGGRAFALDSYVFVEGDSGEHGSWHYSLSENLALNALVPRCETDEEELDLFFGFQKEVHKFMVKFIQAGANLLEEYRAEMGWSRRYL